MIGEGNLSQTLRGAFRVQQLAETDAGLSDRQRPLPVLQRQRIIAEDLAAPPRQHLYWRVVVGGDRFKVFGRGQQFLRDLVVLAALLQQDAQQLDQRTEPRRRFGFRGLRQVEWRWLGEPASNRLQDLATELALRHTFAEAAGSRQRLYRSRRVGGNLEH